jgi:hypothetical protein
MRFSISLRAGVLIATIGLSVLGQTTPTQSAPSQSAPGKDAASEAKGLPPRVSPSEYQFHTQAGAVTIAAELTGHSISTPQGILNTDDYIVIETGLFGAPGARLVLSPDDFTIRINEKKTPLPSRPYGMVIGSVKDPDWEPPVPAESKSKTSLNTGGGGRGEQRDANSPPPVVHVPVPIQRAMAQRVQKASLPEGDRALPVAGLIYFQYRGKTESIHSLELTYNGPAGKATLSLQP